MLAVGKAILAAQGARCADCQRWHQRGHGHGCPRRSGWMPRTLATNNTTWPQPCFIRSLRRYKSGVSPQYWWCLYSGLPGHGAYCLGKAAAISYCEKPAANCASGCEGGHPAARVCGYPTHPWQPLSHAFLPQPASLPAVRHRPSPDKAATASFPGKWGWWPNCCGCCPMPGLTRCLLARASAVRANDTSRTQARTQT